MKEQIYLLPQTLLEIANLFPEFNQDEIEPDDSSFESQLIDDAMDKISTLCPNIVLTKEEIVIIAILFERFLDREKEVRALDIANRLYPVSIKRLYALKNIRNLILKGVVDIRGVSTTLIDQHDNIESKYSLVRLVDSEVIFKETFLQKIVGEGHIHDNLSKTPFSNNREYIECWFAYIQALSEYKNMRNCEFLMLVDACAEESAAKDAQEILSKRSKITKNKFPLDALIEEEDLDEKEALLVVYLLNEEMKDSDCSVNDVIEFISKDKFDQHRNRSYLDTASKLVSRGIVEISENNFFMMKRAEVRLAPDVNRRLLAQESSSDKDRIKQILRGQDIFELKSPVSSFEDLILPSTMKNRLVTAIQRYENNVDAKLREWGLECLKNTRKIHDKDEAPLLMLFSGTSGTGKTFAAEAFAQELGKDILITDISKLLSAWVGESEQNVRRIFYLFDRIIRRCEKPPVLLLNECDQFLSVRGRSSKSVDRMYHQMQNIFLEGFENMRGILIATTNLADNIDPAFSRRFHLKLEFPFPDIELRLALWKKHLLPSIPSTGKIDIEYLAERFDFTGGQIDLVVRNAAIEAAVDGVSLNMSHLKESCRIEASGNRSMTGKPSAKIGFTA